MRFGSETRTREQWLRTVFPPVSREVEAGTLTSSKAQDVACRYVAEHWPDAKGVFLYGSIVERRYKPFSDVDLVVIVSQLRHDLRIRCSFDGLPIEAHIFDEASFGRDLIQAERSGVPGVGLATRNALVILDTDGTAARLKQASSRVFERGPQELSSIERAYLRRNVTTKLAELLGARPLAERAIVAAALRELLYILHFCSEKMWRYSGNWAARMAPDFGERLEAAIESAISAREPDKLFGLARELVIPIGGFGWADDNLIGREASPNPTRQD